ncbi:glycosyltransferase family 39 protein [Polyangium mundeleinium]|uniref:Glycosyltransferase RgtA/B/C/D-like domain-containing protein n=1 Tax=Polyangium mundeleinium TaxID=2995306 RepID=A0ABT5EFA7_9BACT|nr:glycosyltransferase family 39 protein [Polyangium mundeleinium]MDC0740024.1 hypothetical protein [Polyangium mundeleinium]
MLARLLPLWRRLPAFLGRVLPWLVGLGAVAYVGIYLVLAVLHLRYPFELEWMEGGAVDHVRHILSGKRLYDRPTIDFVPFIYTPLYFYVSAAASKVVGLGFFSLRLISFLSSLGCFALLALFVHRETKNRLAAVLAVGLFAGTYRESSAFMDIARVDSLALLFLLLGLYVLRFREGLGFRLLAVALFLLSFLTKQSMLVAAAPLAVYALFADGWKRGLGFGVALFGTIGLSILALDRLHGGWFRYYVFFLPSQHPNVPAMWVDYWIEDLFAPLAVSFGAALYWFAASGEGARKARLFWFFAAAGALGTSWGGRLHAGGWPNVLMPAFSVLAILFGLGVATALESIGQAPEALRARLRAAAFGVAALQLACVIYDPRRLVPSRSDEQAGHAFVKRLAALPGDVWLPAHGHLPTLAGKRPFAHEMAMQDILGIGGGPPGTALRDELREALKTQRFGAVIPDTDFFKKEINLFYQRNEKDPPLFGGNDFFPVTGMKTRPRGVFSPRPVGQRR